METGNVECRKGNGKKGGNGRRLPASEEPGAPRLAPLRLAKDPSSQLPSPARLTLAGFMRHRP